jgi:hypothetical protein
MNSGTWRSARRELAVATGFVVALGAATWALLGPVQASLVVLGCATLGLLAIQALPARRVPPASQPDIYYDVPSTTFAGFWRTQTDLSDAIASMSAWDLNTRRRLQNLLAARLAERHGISLADDPEAARAALLGLRAADGSPGGGRPGGPPGSASTAGSVSTAGRGALARSVSPAGRADLWYWIDPQRPTPADATARPGIPPRVLAALIQRLEQL